MPLCERLRLDAGRSFTQTLTVRVYVALALLAIVLAVTNKSDMNASKYNIYYGNNHMIESGSKFSDTSILASKGIMLAKTESSHNATYGR